MTIKAPLIRSIIPPRTAAQPDELRPLSMRTNFAWTLAGSGVYGASQWGMLIALAKMGSADMVGRFALGLAICAPVIMFFNMQLCSIQATDARNEYQFRDYLRLRLLSSAAALLTIASIAIIAGYRAEVTLVIMVIALAKAVESVSDVIFGLLQKYERLDLISRSFMMKGPASLAALAVIIHYTGSVAWGAAGMLAVWASILLLFDARNARRLLAARGELPRANRTASPWLLVKRLAWLALPLGLVGLLDSLGTNVPRYVVEREAGEAALGHYAAMAYIIVAGNLVVAALANSAAPRLSRRYVNDLRAFKQLVWKLVEFGAALGLCGALLAAFAGRAFLSVLYTPEYAAHANVFVWLMVAAGLGYIARFLVCSMTAARQFRAQAPLYVTTLAIISALSFILIPRHGLLGGAWAACAGAATLLLGAIYINLRAIKLRAAFLKQSTSNAPEEVLESS